MSSITASMSIPMGECGNELRCIMYNIFICQIFVCNFSGNSHNARMSIYHTSHENFAIATGKHHRREDRNGISLPRGEWDFRMREDRETLC